LVFCCALRDARDLQPDWIQPGISIAKLYNGQLHKHVISRSNSDTCGRQDCPDLWLPLINRKHAQAHMSKHMCRSCKYQVSKSAVATHKLPEASCNLVNN